jgi:serine/threonine protein kinase/tetratricopeptide (TPR) repeat protein
MPEIEPEQVDDAVDAIADEFEREWKAGRRPDLRQFAARLDDGRRLRLLIELICVDWEYRLRDGGRVDLQTYLGQFPDLAGVEENGASDTLRRFAARLQAVPSGVPVPTDAIPRVTGGHPPGPHCGGSADTPGDAAATMTYPPATSAGVPAAPRVIAGRYRLVSELGRGTFGSVWRAIDQLLEKEGEQRGLVAVKLLRPRAWAGGAELESALDEARAMFPIDHPNVLHVKDAGYDPPARSAFIVMQLCYEERDGRIVRGQTLQERIDQGGPLPPREAARVMVDVCRGVAAAHAQGRVHRDLAPKNILLRTASTGARGTLWPVVSDFGLSLSRFRQRGDSPRDESTSLRFEPPAGGEVCGTPAYMAPEQADGAPATPLSDVFGLGGILYFVLSRQMPYVPLGTHPDRAWDVIEQKRARRPARPLRVPRLPRRLAAICAQAMAPDPLQRYGSAAEMADELEAWLDHRPTLKTRPRQGRPELARLWYRRHRAAATVGLVGVAAVVASTALYVHSVDVARADRRLADQEMTHKDQTAKLLASDAQDWESLTLRTINAMMSELRAQRARAGAVTPESAGMVRVIGDGMGRLLAKSRDASPQVNRGLGIALVQLGDQFQSVGDSEKAAAAYRQALAIFTGATTDPTDVTARQTARDTTAARVRLGRLCLRAGRVDEARAMLDAAIRVTAPMSRAPDADASALREHWGVLLGAGDLALQTGDADAAVARFDEAVQVLAATEPASTADSRADRSTTLNRLAAALLQRFDRTGQAADVTRARDCASRAADIERLAVMATSKPATGPALPPASGRGLLTSLEHLAAAAVRAGDFGEARRRTEEGRILLGRLRQATPPNAAHELAVDAAALSDLEARMDTAAGRQPAAEAAYRQAFDALDRLRRDGQLAIDPRAPHLFEQVAAALRGTPAPHDGSR